MFYLEQIKMFSLFYFVTICFSFLWEIQCLFCFVFLFLFQNIQGIYLLFKKIREKITKKTFAYHSEIYLSDGEALCSTEQTYARRSGKMFLLRQSCPVNLRYVYFSCCAGRTRGSISVAQTCGPHHQQISEIFLLCQQSSRHYVTRKMCGTTPPTNIATDVFEECATCLL